MSRPKKNKNICKLPDIEFFTSNTQSDKITIITVEEYEVIRLIDKEKLNQEECSKRMNVSRQSIQILYSNARSKIAEFLVKGGKLQIEGGSYELCQGGQCKCHGDSANPCNCNTNGMCNK